MHTRHAHRHPGAESPPTSGRLIRWARFYDPLVWLLTLGQARALRALPLDLADLRPGERVLDVGCGTGDLTLAAAPRVGPGGVVYGIDASPEMIAVARRKARRSGRPVRFRLEPVEALRFPAGSFDVVLSSLMMHHLPGDLKREALVQILRVLRPGGRLVIVDMAEAAGPHPLWHAGALVARLHGRLRTRAVPPPPGLPALATLLSETGFVAVASGPTRVPWLAYARAQAPA